MIRAARPHEYKRLRDIERRAGELYREIGMPEIADDEPPSADDLASGAALYVATDDEDQPVGYALVDLVDGHAHLEQLSVVPEHCRQGMGQALVEAVVDWARARGDLAVTLTTFRDVAFNAPFYVKHGFTALDDGDLTDGLQAVVARETSEGLDPTTRVVMRRSL